MFYQYQHFGTSEYFCKEYGVNFNFPNHLHRSFELITVKKGSMRVTVDGKSYTVESGEAVLVFPNQIHSLESKSCEHMLIIFSPDIVGAYYTKIKHKAPKDGKIKISQYLASQLDVLEADATKIKMKAVLYQLCAELDENTEYTDEKREEEHLLYSVFDYVEKSYAGVCTLESLAKTLGFSYFYLSHYFNNAVGMSFNSYVNRYRISKACYILNNSSSTVLECAYECGYASLRSFNRNFKLHTGVTPNEYRKASH